jgi:ketosteroid isomerase-like protein
MRFVVFVVLATLCNFDARAEEPRAAAQEAIQAFIGAVASADPVAVEAVLAPEFQIMRAGGVGYDRQAYLTEGLPVVTLAAWEVEDLSATATGDLLVALYYLVIDETIDGQRVAKRAPRLTVFRRDAEHWRVVAHANFAAQAAQ